jgi:hypothetical protein
VGGRNRNSTAMRNTAVAATTKYYDCCDDNNKWLLTIVVYVLSALARLFWRIQFNCGFKWIRNTRQ